MIKMKNILIVMMLLCGIPSYAQYYVIHAWAPHKSDNPLFECNWYPDETVEGTSLTCFILEDNNGKFLKNFVDIEYEDGTKCLFFPDKLNDIVVKGEPYIVYAPVRKPVEDLLSLSGTTRALFSNNKCSIDVCYNDEGMVYRSSMEFEYEIFDVNFNNINSYLCIDDIIQINYNAPLPCQSVIEYSIDNGLSYSFFKIVPANVSFATITWDEVKDRNINTSFKVRIKYELDGVDYYASKTQRIPEFYPYYPLDEKELYVINDSLHIPLNTTYKDDGISVNSYFEQVGNKTFQGRELNKDGYLDYNFKGPYRLTFSRTNYCSVERYVFVPEVKYNKVNGSDNEFWYGDQTTNAVTLSYKYPDNSSNQLNFSHSTNNNCDISSTEETDGKISVYSLSNNSITEELDCKVSTYNFNTDTCLKKISLNIDDQTGTKKFVPVFQTVKLSAYPNISVTDTKILDATCYYDTAVVTISDIEGGLSNGYKFKLEKDGKEFWSENSTMKIPATIFGGNEQEVKLYVYDKEDISEDTGREKRAFSTNIKLNYGEKLDIKNWQVADLNCFEDNTGKISITDWTPKNDDIKFEVWNSDKKVSDSQITENLAAGDYNLKIVDGNDCVNDSFQVTVNQPDKLQTSVKSFEPPLCYGYADGKITTTTIGGTGDYTFLWNNGATTSDIENLNAGIYQLTVTDENECQTSVSQVLTEPEELKNSLQSSFTICKGNELKIDDGENGSEKFTSYEWSLPDGTKCFDRVLVVTPDMPAGNYILTSKSESCFTQDTTNIQFSENNLPIRFLIPTESYLGDTIMVCEDSEIFTEFDWYYTYNKELLTDVSEIVNSPHKNLSFLYAEQSGFDTVTMYVNDGNCTASMSKQIVILPEYRSEKIDNQPIISGIFTRLAIVPNPNDGNFTLYANLSEESELKINLLDVSRSQKIALNYEKNATLSDHYEIPFQGLGLTTGVYCLILTAQGETKQIKFTVK